MTLSGKLKKSVKRVKQQKVSPPVWEGPSGVGPNGGVTQSIIGRWLCCRERARLLLVEGLRPRETFEPRIEFGNMWHVCEESFAKGGIDLGLGWETGLKVYGQGLCKRYLLDQEKINHWYEIAKALFPRYIEYWASHSDVQAREPLLSEQVFDVPYQLPSGRSVRLRGKWDSVDMVDGSIWLQENKTKGSIDQQKLTRQLTFDLQTMMYLIAMWNSPRSGEYGWSTTRNRDRGLPSIVGVRYNVIRRSAHKTVTSMLEKLNTDCRGGRADEWFCRLNVAVSLTDIARFGRECLDPILENMTDDYDWWCVCKMDGKSPFDGISKSKVNWPRSSLMPRTMHHFRMPYGVYNVIQEGGFGDLDAHLETGSEVGLERTNNLFPEL